MKGLCSDPVEAGVCRAASDLPDGILSIYQQHAIQSSQMQSDGAKLHAEHLRTDYLISKSRVDFAQATGVRAVEESGSGMARVIGWPGALPGSTKLPGT
jgi:hypothetical protein